MDILEKSVEIFNINYSSDLGVTFGGNARNYRYASSSSKEYPNLGYHFEFWDDKGKLYACVHTQHHQKNENLIRKIKGLEGPVLKKLKTSFPDYKFKNERKNGSSGAGIKHDSHVINIPIKKTDAKFDADVMNEIIKTLKAKL